VVYIGHPPSRDARPHWQSWLRFAYSLPTARTSTTTRCEQLDALLARVGQLILVLALAIILLTGLGPVARGSSGQARGSRNYRGSAAT
jgi:hypothetical protein